MTRAFREVSAATIRETVARLCVEANVFLPEDVKAALRRAEAEEPFERARALMARMAENARVAEETGMPVCQDTGMAVVFADVGQGAAIVDGDFEEAIHAGVADGYRRGYLRASVVRDPLRRGNTGDNTPAVIHTRIVRGDRVTLTVAPKGFGSENMSALKMLTPGEGREGVAAFVVDTLRRAGGNPCPPTMIGVGLGGTFDAAAVLAKRALLLPPGGRHEDAYYAALEDELLARVNALGIGPQGFGGRTTALSVRILTYPTHIAGLPVAVNVGCHVTRHATATL